jgi:protoheme IX farnesyltransferase
MKASATTTAPVMIASERSAFAIWSDLVKARLTVLVLLTTLAGFYAGVEGATDWILLAHALFGTALVACGAAALNQWWEREHDARMPRTEMRPLPAKELSESTVLVAGGLLSIGGLVHLALFVNLLTSLLGAITLLCYVLIYTPLKRVTTLNTAIGAIPGALPPLMGWTAARDGVSREGWALFAILFFWQLPHFLSIAWLYREEYAKAGFVMLPVRDPQGVRTGRQAISHTLGLIPVSICPALFGMSGVIYFFGALLLGLAFLWCAIQFSRELTRARARQLFFASILYLPLLFGLMALDKVRH